MIARIETTWHKTGLQLSNIYLLEFSLPCLKAVRATTQHLVAPQPAGSTDRTEHSNHDLLGHKIGGRPANTPQCKRPWWTVAGHHHSKRALSQALLTTHFTTDHGPLTTAFDLSTFFQSDSASEDSSSWACCLLFGLLFDDFFVNFFCRPGIFAAGPASGSAEGSSARSGPWPSPFSVSPTYDIVGYTVQNTPRNILILSAYLLIKSPYIHVLYIYIFTGYLPFQACIPTTFRELK